MFCAGGGKVQAVAIDDDGSGTEAGLGVNSCAEASSDSLGERGGVSGSREVKVTYGAAEGEIADGATDGPKQGTGGLGSLDGGIEQPTGDRVEGAAKRGGADPGKRISRS